MFLEQGDDPSIGEEAMFIVLQPIQHSYKPVNNIFLPLGPNAMGIWSCYGISSLTLGLC